MKANVKLMVVIGILTVIVTACGPGQLFGPTITPSPTITMTPTATFTPTITPSPTITLSPTLTPTPTLMVSCTIPSGKWEGEVKENSNYYMYVRKPLVSFEIINCTVQSLGIWSFPALNEIFFSQVEIIPILNDAFTYDAISTSGTHTIDGTFTSQTSAIGTLFFPKGFVVNQSVTTSDVTLHWSAHPSE